jgi:hypothetical protein
LPLSAIKIELILVAGCCNQIISKLQYGYIVSESREKEVERFRGSGFGGSRVQRRRRPKKTAGLIEKETK